LVDLIFVFEILDRADPASFKDLYQGRRWFIATDAPVDARNLTRMRTRAIPSLKNPMALSQLAGDIRPVPEVC
jgi:hypothetical protein